MKPPQVYMCSPSWTLLPPPSPYHPSGLSQCTSPKHPVSCIEPGLATRFIHDILHYIYIISAAAAAAKSLQLCPTLCHPIEGSPPGSPFSGILQARVWEWGAIAFSDVHAHWILNNMMFSPASHFPVHACQVSSLFKQPTYQIIIWPNHVFCICPFWTEFF